MDLFPGGKMPKLLYPMRKTTFLFIMYTCTKTSNCEFHMHIKNTTAPAQQCSWVPFMCVLNQNTLWRMRQTLPKCIWIPGSWSNATQCISRSNSNSKQVSPDTVKQKISGGLLTMLDNQLIRPLKKLEDKSSRKQTTHITKSIDPKRRWTYSLEGKCQSPNLEMLTEICFEVWLTVYAECYMGTLKIFKGI